MMKLRKKVGPLSAFLLVATVILSTASTCGHSGGGNGGGGSSNSDSGTNINIVPDYEFSQIRLRYKLPQRSISYDPFLDQSDFYSAHGSNPTSGEGEFSSLRSILNEESVNYASGPASITVIISPVSSSPDTLYLTPSDVGDTYVSFRQNYGPNINSITFMAKSITTYYYHHQLCWSKTFDLNQQWWTSLPEGERDFSALAKLNTVAYMKTAGSSDVFWVRRVGNQYEVVAGSYEQLRKINGVVQCDTEIVVGESTIFSSELEGGIYIGDTIDDEYGWQSPIEGSEMVDPDGPREETFIP